jgi:hypothetical protein
MNANAGWEIVSCNWRGEPLDALRIYGSPFVEQIRSDAYER